MEAALSGRAATIDDGYDSLDVGGAGATLGGGIEYFASRNLAFEAALEFMYGTFSQGRLNGGAWEDLGDGGFAGTSTRVNLGIAWHP